VTWNYRLTKLGDVVAVREVYYDEYNVVASWTADPVSLSGDSRNDVIDDIRLITECLREPVLDLDHIQERFDVRMVLGEHLNNGCTDPRCDPTLNKRSEFRKRFIDHLAEEVQGVRTT